MGNCDPYSDSPEPMVVEATTVYSGRGADIVMQSSHSGRAGRGTAVTSAHALDRSHDQQTTPRAWREGRACTR